MKGPLIGEQRWLTAGLSLLLLSGCGDSAKKTAAVDADKQAPAYYQPDPATAGAVKGTITFKGKVPPAKRISMEAEEDCQKLHKEPVLDTALVTGSSQGLANVFVYVKTGLEGKTFAPAAEAVVLEQKGCQFVPRVMALRAGQTLAVKNSDPVSHNIHPMPKNNRDWNQQQPPGAADLKRKFAYPEVMIPVKCNVHAWMKSYIGVLDHPYFAVTNADGAYEFKNLPPGEYTIAAWHEQLGEKTQKITVGQSAAVETPFEFTASPR